MQAFITTFLPLRVNRRSPLFRIPSRYGIKWSRVLSAGFIHLIESTLKYRVKCVKIFPSGIVLETLEKRSEEIVDEDMTQYLQEVLKELEKERLNNL